MEPTTDPQTEQTKDESAKPQRKPWFLMAFALLLLGGMVYGIVISYGAPKYGLNMPADKVPFDVPQGASNICYALQTSQWPGYAYECDVPEDKLVAWAGKRGYSVNEITVQPVQIERYLKYAQGDDLPDESVEITIAEGLHAESMSEPDIGMAFAYDRKTGRAYFWALGR